MRTSALCGLSLLGLFVACGGEEPVTEEAGSDESEYRTVGTCDGLPRIPLETPDGVCVGVVATGLKFPRGLAQMPNGDLVVADMGGWAKDRGSVWLFSKRADGTFTRRQLLSQIDKPSGIAVGPDNLVYVGTPADVFRFDPYENRQPQPRLKLVIRNLAGAEGGRHPLRHMAFDPTHPWHLYVNVGSDSDVCESEGFAFPCTEVERENPRGAIYAYDLSAGDHTEAGHTVAARGLRNSMALAFHPVSGLLLQGENSRDSIDKVDPSLREVEGELPHEELNVIEPGAHYGWPYCYDNGVAAPEYAGHDCSSYRTPALLLPGHAAPLGMEYYHGSNKFPAAYRGNLILAFHGYREYGHRIVMVPVDERGVPNGELRDIVRGWEKTTTQPQGAPVDVLIGKDGAIYVSEDKNGTLLRISYDGRGDGTPLVPKPPRKPAMTDEERERCESLANQSGSLARMQHVLDAACVSCHGAGPGYAGGLALLRCDATGNAERLLEPRRNADPLVIPNDENSELIKRLNGDGFPQMPAGGINPEQMEEVLTWIREGSPKE